MEELSAGPARVVIDHDAGGRLSSLSVDGLELLLPRVDDDIGWGCFPMVPWAGRIRDGRFRFGGVDHQLTLTMPPNAVHGTGWHRPWTRTGPGELETELGPGWPFRGRARQQVTLHADRLELSMTVEADEVMPVSAGWHPWWRRRLDRGGPAVLDLPARRMWRRDADGLPDGTVVARTPGPWDDCFTGPASPVTLTWAGALALTLEHDLRHVVVYDQKPEAVCVEPQSAPPDAHRNGIDLVLVQPGAPWTIGCTWRWAPAPRQGT